MKPIRLLFLGDISVAHPYNDFTDIPAFFYNADLVLANMEGPIVPCSSPPPLNIASTMTLYNTLHLIGVLNSFHIRAVYLANNHINDIPQQVKFQKQLLSSAGVSSFGAGINVAQAGQPLSLRKGGSEIKFFAFGWDVIGCKPATLNTEGVNPFTPQNALDTVRRYRSQNQHSLVVYIIHWNYELEIYPQPAHRQLAHDLVHEGVDAIIGLHPHVAQGAELINNKPIIYSLGNWFFPPRQLGHFQLRYPEISSRELALELVVEGRCTKSIGFHWHQFDPENCSISFEKTEGWGGEILKGLTPYRDMGNEEYFEWFRDNRTRRRGLPIYKDYHQTFLVRLNDSWVKLRQTVIKNLVRMKIKNGPQD